MYLLYRLRPRSAAAERRNPMGGECEILSVGRLTNGEVAVLISHHCQCHGLRTELLAKLMIVVPTRSWASVCGMHWRTRSLRLSYSSDNGVRLLPHVMQLFHPKAHAPYRAALLKGSSRY